MEKKNVVIYVAGQRFSISTSDSEEYVIGIGEKVDVMIRGIAKDNPRLNRDACAILAALDLCDDETKLRQMMEVLRSQVKDYLETNETLREENEALKAQLRELSEKTPQPQSTYDTQTATEAETVITSVTPVPSKAEAAVMAEASEQATRHTAFVGKDFHSGKKNKKNKKHGKAQTPQPVAPAVSASTTAVSNSDEDGGYSPYHQFSIFDDIE